MPDMLSTVKRAALEAVANSSPSDVMFGTVESVSPISIRVDQRFTVPASCLVLTSLVSDFDVTTGTNYQTEDAESHHHAVLGDKVIRVKLGLSVGESVILIRSQGGQKFIVLDRVRGG